MNNYKPIANASWRPPTDAEALELKTAARRMLARAWANPDALGDASEIFWDAYKLLEEVKRHASPTQPANSLTGVVDFQQALKLAWLAAWRAKDFSLDGFMKRSRSEHWQTTVDSDAQKICREYGGAYWFREHFPLYDSAGKDIPYVESNKQQRFQFERYPEFFEGSMIAKPEEIANQMRSNFSWACVTCEVKHRSAETNANSALFMSADGVDLTGQTKVPELGGVIAFGPFRITKFQASSLHWLQGARFEAGIILSGQLDKAVTIPSIETGWGLEFADLDCAGGIAMGNRPGVRRITGSGMRVQGAFELEARQQIALVLSAKTANTFGRLSASSTWFDELTLQGVQTGSLDLRRCRLLGPVNLQGLYVSGECRMTGLEIMQGAPGGQANFSKASFLQGADFSGAKFERAVLFDGAKFGQAAVFGGACFADNAYFNRAEFSSSANFDNRSGTATVFKGEVVFSGDGSSAPSGTFQRVDFRGAEFCADVRFRNREFCDDTTFEDAIFHCAPSFHGAKLHTATSFAKAKYLWKRRLRSSLAERVFVARWLSWRNRRDTENVRLDTILLKNTASSFRDLTALAKTKNLTDLAFRFHKEELEARTLHPINSDVGRSEAWAGSLYGLLGDFGNDFVRPLLVWLGVLVACAVIYNASAPASADRADAALTLSLAAQTRPFVFLEATFGRFAEYKTGGAWPHDARPPVASDPCADQQKGEHKATLACLSSHLIAYHDREFKILATFQSMASLVLLFLAALGLRRKFQTS